MKKIVSAAGVFLLFAMAIHTSVAHSAELFGIEIPGTVNKSLPIPHVAHHKIRVTAAEIQDLCEKRVEEQEMPCVVVNQGDEICYAYIDLSGVSEEVQCFLREDEQYVTN